MKEFKEQVMESIDAIEERTEDEPVSSAWDSPDESVGTNVKAKAGRGYE